MIRNVVDEAVLADQLGIDFIGVGEHHRDDFAVSSPEIVLAAIAGRTERIRLGSAVTVLSSDDPVRVFQRFSTLDAVSNGRAEVILGRGSFIESFPLFGYELSDYEQLFEEKLDLFVQLLREQPVTWAGDRDRRSTGLQVYPRTDSGALDHVGRRRRQPAVGGSRRPARPAADDRHHRRREPPLPPVRRPLPPRPRTSSAGRRSRSACTRPATSPRPTSWPASSCTRT